MNTRERLAGGLEIVDQASTPTYAVSKAVLYGIVSLTDTNLEFATEEYTNWSWDGLDELENKEDPTDDDDDDTRRWEQCQGEKDDGSQCGIADPSRLDDNGYCRYHRAQKTGDDGETATV
jgi:hypothetical protein